MPSRAPARPPDRLAAIVEATRALADAARLHAHALDVLRDLIEHDAAVDGERTSSRPTPPLVLVHSGAGGNEDGGEGDVDDRRRALARERQQRRREKLRAVTLPVTLSRSHVTLDPTIAGEQGAADAPLTFTKPHENTAAATPVGHLTGQRDSVTAPRDSVTVTPSAAHVVTSSLVSPSETSRSSLSSAPSSSPSSDLGSRDTGSATPPARACGTAPADGKGFRAVIDGSHWDISRRAFDSADDAAHAPKPAPARRSDGGVWQAVQECGRVHVSICGLGSALFADPSVNGGVKRVKHLAFGMYDACSEALRLARRTLVALSEPATIDVAIRVAARAYRLHAERGGRFVDFRHALTTTAIVETAAKAVRRERRAETTAPEPPRCNPFADPSAKLPDVLKRPKPGDRP